MTYDADGTVVDGGVMCCRDAYYAVRAVFGVFSETQDASICVVSREGVAACVVRYAGGVLLKIGGYSRRGTRLAGVDSARSGGVVTLVEAAALVIGRRRYDMLYGVGAGCLLTA